MPDHNFEEQVHRKLDNMQLQPSDAVWKRVEAQITRKQKRRRWAIWLPLLVCCSTAGWYLYPLIHAPGIKNIHPVVEQPVAILPNNNNRPIIKYEPDAHHPTKNNGIEIVGTNHTGTVRLKTNTIAAPEKTTRNVQPGLALRKAVPATGDAYALKHKAGVPEVVRGAVLYKSIASGKENSAGDTSLLNSITLHHAVTTHKLAEPDIFVNTSLSAVNKQPLHVAVSNKQPPASGWEWMLSAAFGKAGIHNGSYATGGRTQAYSPGSYTSSALNTVAIPLFSGSHPGAVFTVGLTARRHLYGRLSWSAGLQYSLFPTYGITVNRLDSAVNITPNAVTIQTTNGSFTVVQQQQTGRVQLLALPVQLHARLTGSHQLPVYGNIGAVVSRVFSANSMFNKTQCSIITGMDMRFFSTRRMPVLLGPQLQYGVTNLYKTAVADNRRLFSYSLKATLRLRQKLR